MTKLKPKPKPKFISYGPEWTPENRKYERYRWVENPENGLRLHGKVHEVTPDGYSHPIVKHTGWFIDNYQSETVHGLVFRLPSRHGVSQFVPAVSDPFGNGACLDFRSVTDDLVQAIRNADTMAEWYAEDAREYDAKECARTRQEEIESEIKDLYAQSRALCSEIRANCDKLAGLAELRKLIRSAIRQTRSEVRKLRAEWRKLDNDYWEIVPRH